MMLLYILGQMVKKKERKKKKQYYTELLRIETACTVVKTLTQGCR
jgi:surface polysaccharide O-acyltransferase-like enzyme